MKKIDSTAALNDGINKILAKSSAICTNFFLPADETERAVVSGEIFTEAWDGGILIFRKRETYFRTYFYLADPAAPVTCEIPAPAVLEIPYRDRDEAAKNAVRGFTDAGFAPLFQRIRMTRRGSEVYADSDAVRASADDTEKLKVLFRENFHPLAGCIPTDAELSDEIRAGHILTDDACAGLLHFTEGKAGTELRHLAVEEAHRNRGIGSALVRAYLGLCGVKKSTVWVRDDNDAAKKTYEKHGYRADGMKSAVLIIQK